MITKQPRNGSMTLAWLIQIVCVLGGGVCQEVAAQDTDTLAEMQSAVIDSGFRRLLREEPSLLHGGSQKFEEGDHWMVVAVGRAALETLPGKRMSLSDATKVARTKANRNLAEYIDGITFSGKDSVVVRSIESGGRSKIVDIFRSMSESKVAALLSNTEVAGNWRLDNGQSVCVMVAIANPEHPWHRQRRHTISKIQLAKEHWNDAWRDRFLSRPAILTGGASIIKTSTGNYLLVVGKARLKILEHESPFSEDSRKKKSEAEIQAIKSARNSADREALQFIGGTRVTSTNLTVQEQIRVTADEVTLLNEFKETFASTRSEKITGIVRGLRQVGEWQSTDGTLRYVGCVAEL